MTPEDAWSRGKGTSQPTSWMNVLAGHVVLSAKWIGRLMYISISYFLFLHKHNWLNRYRQHECIENMYIVTNRYERCYLTRNRNVICGVGFEAWSLSVHVRLFLQRLIPRDCDLTAERYHLPIGTPFWKRTGAARERRICVGVCSPSKRLPGHVTVTMGGAEDCNIAWDTIVVIWSHRWRSVTDTADGLDAITQAKGKCNPRLDYGIGADYINWHAKTLTEPMVTYCQLGLKKSNFGES